MLRATKSRMRQNRCPEVLRDQIRCRRASSKFMSGSIPSLPSPWRVRQALPLLSSKDDFSGGVFYCTGTVDFLGMYEALNQAPDDLKAINWQSLSG